MAAAPGIVSDELWELIEPLLPKREQCFRYPGASGRGERGRRARARGWTVLAPDSLQS